MNRRIYFWIFLSSILISVGCSESSTRINSSFKSLHNPDESDYYIEDALSGHFHVPNAVREYDWEEHPKGKIKVTTNNLGFKNDKNTIIEKQTNTTRILITGDSHTDGVLYNNESVASHLENLLNDSSKNKKYECLNAGVGYFSFQNYLGTLKKFLYLKPDVFIVIVYTGNDFIESIRIEAMNERLNVPERPADYYDDLWKIDEIAPGFTGQVINQLKFFKTFPAFKDTAIAIAIQNFEEIQRLCKQNNIELLAVLLPTKADVESETDSERLTMVREQIGLSYEDSEINKTLAHILEKSLQSRTIKTINLQLIWEQDTINEFFWKADYHVNHRGHEAMAVKIFEKIN